MNNPAEGAVKTDAELVKLAHALGVAPERLSALAAVPPGDLRVLRGQVSEALFRADKHHFTKIAALAKAAPVAIAAKLTEVAFPPLLAARTAELLDPQRAVELVARLPDRYLADVSAVMEPSRAPDVIAHIPPERVARVAIELARRQEWVVIGGFVAQVSPAGLAASVAALDGEQLLRISFVLDELTRLDRIATLLTDTQLDQLLRAAAERGLWHELDALAGHLRPERLARVADRVATAPPELAAAFRAAAERGELSPATLAATTGSG